MLRLCCALAPCLRLDIGKLQFTPVTVKLRLMQTGISADRRHNKEYGQVRF